MLTTWVYDVPARLLLLSSTASWRMVAKTTTIPGGFMAADQDTLREANKEWRHYKITTAKLADLQVARLGDRFPMFTQAIIEFRTQGIRLGYTT